MTDQDPANLFDGAMPDLGGLLESAQQMMASAQAAADEVVVGTAGGGLVKIEVDGHHEFQNVSIDPRAIDLDDLTLLEDLVLAALHDSSVQLQKLQEGAVAGLGLGGLDLGGLGLGGPGTGLLDAGQDEIESEDQ